MCCQLFVTVKGFVYVVPMKGKSEVLQGVKKFSKDIGVPDAIILDAAGEQTYKTMRKYCSGIGTTLRYLEEGNPWSKKAKIFISLIKESIRKAMKHSDYPLDFWGYRVECQVRINNLTSKITFSLHKAHAYTSLIGREGGITNLCQYKWYNWYYYRDQKEHFPFNREVLGRVLDPAKGKGNEMAQCILKSNGYVFPRQALRPVHVDEIHSPVDQKKQNIFGALIKRRWGTFLNSPPISTMINDDIWEEHED